MSDAIHGARRGSLPQRKGPTVPSRLRSPLAARIAVVVVALAAWELMARAMESPDVVPTFTQVGRRLLDGLGGGRLWSPVGHTMQAWALSLGLSMVIGVAIGAAMGASKIARAAGHYLVEFLRSTPAVALVPLAVLLFRGDVTGKVFLASFAATWPILIQTMYGVMSIPQTRMDTASAYGLTRYEYFTRVVMPSATTYVATGVRIASSLALVLAITGELLLGSPGLGQELQLAQLAGDATGVYMIAFLSGVLGLLLNSMFMAIDRRFIHWSGESS